MPSYLRITRTLLFWPHRCGQLVQMSTTYSVQRLPVFRKGNVSIEEFCSLELVPNTIVFLLPPARVFLCCSAIQLFRPAKSFFLFWDGGSDTIRKVALLLICCLHIRRMPKALVHHYLDSYIDFFVLRILTANFC